MQITVIKGRLEEEKSDLVILNMFAKAKNLGGAAKNFDFSVDKKLSQTINEDGFDGELGDTLLVHAGGKRVLMVGLGEQKDFDLQVVREVSAVAYKIARKVKAKRVVSILHGAGGGKLPAFDCARAQVEGLLLGAYEFNKYKKQPDKKQHQILDWEIVSDHPSHFKEAKKGAEVGRLVAMGMKFARDMVNEPAQEMHPEALARAAEKISKASHGKIKVKIYAKAEIAKMKMGGLLGVNQGSVSEPLFVHMRYKNNDAKKKVCVIGKAITFDSGGLSLKMPQMMETMKCDMAGAAAVLGVFSILAELSPKINVDGIFAATENMPSGSAIRPGDVLRAMNGKTMEIISTDAEGRLTLADALSYASKLKPDAIVDLATLTGHCRLAIGEEISGLMGNNEKLLNKLVTAAESSGEKLCVFPLDKRYKKIIESKIADMKNGGAKYGGVITSGLFLQEFVDENIPWAHIDIAGPAFVEQDMNSYTPYGGTGAGVATIIEFLRGA